ncbi:peroxiredoxin [Pararhodobacter sp. SW119]|uniref:peroxiredoxin n=1 Tax=Pararhodobacter sp. SW119 TaxID=2780075 RepID=UPI001AE09769|nr:peroxiredoxin [Pararhodobacter sp. SW119]
MLKPTLSVGATLPDATLLTFGPEGPQEIQLRDRLQGRRVVLFAVPGAFTPTCDSAHLPSFIRTADALRAKGVDEIICLSVNDVHVMRYWGEVSGATAAGITMAADPAAEFTRAVGMDFSAPAAGMYDRSRRYAMLVEDGVVRILHIEEKRGVCEISGGETLLDAL